MKVIEEWKLLIFACILMTLGSALGSYLGSRIGIVWSMETVKTQIEDNKFLLRSKREIVENGKTRVLRKTR